jgi:hypothetical protein
MNRSSLHAGLLLSLAAGISGWTFHEIIQPRNVLDMIRLLATC